MRRIRLMITACASLAWAATGLASSTPQENCDYARVTAWNRYVACVETALAKEARGTVPDPNAAFAVCRHAYFHKWVAFQSRTASLGGSLCIGARFTDNGDGTVSDNLSGLVWEKKDDAGDVHDKDSVFTWSASGTAGDGSAFASFLESLNTAGLGQIIAYHDWRLPTVMEVQTIVFDFPCTGGFGSPSCACPLSPCIDPGLDAAHTQAGAYWTATSVVHTPGAAWALAFDSGAASPLSKAGNAYVRAVRGGW